MSRRARLSPDRAGIPVAGSRRVAGLRRNEVATLADVSIEYYTKIERGNLAGVSDGVLEAIARALQLDDAEREYLFGLARVAHGGAEPIRRRKPNRWVARESLVRALDAITTGPAFVRNGRMDILAVNLLGRAFYDRVFDGPGAGNLARFSFLDERSRDFYPDWDAASDVTVAILRTEAGRDPRDKQLHDLIGELSTRSDEFRTRWGGTQRPPTRLGNKELPPPSGRRPHPDLRGSGVDRRTGAVLPDLHRRTRFAQSRTTGSACQLGRC